MRAVRSLSRTYAELFTLSQTAEEQAAHLHRAPCLRLSWTFPLRRRRTGSTSAPSGLYAVVCTSLLSQLIADHSTQPVTLAKLLLEHLATFALDSTAKATTRQQTLTDTLPTSLVRLETSLQESVASLTPVENGIGSLLKMEKKRKASLGPPVETR